MYLNCGDFLNSGIVEVLGFAINKAKNQKAHNQQASLSLSRSLSREFKGMRHVHGETAHFSPPSLQFLTFVLSLHHICAELYA